jgi:hypothetical protein
MGAVNIDAWYKQNGIMSSNKKNPHIIKNSQSVELTVERLSSKYGTSLLYIFNVFKLIVDNLVVSSNW